eukprot:gene5849-8070_t
MCSSWLFMTNNNPGNFKFKSDVFKERMKQGILRPDEVDRMFYPPKYDIDNIIRSPTTKGFIGFIIGLESLVDISTVVGYATAILAADFNQPTPSPLLIRDLVGGTFKDLILGLGWDNFPGVAISGDYRLLSKYEHRFYDIMEKIIMKLPNLVPSSGAPQLLKQIIIDRNEVTVSSYLPRDLAVKILVKSRYSSIFETAGINPDNLVRDTLLPYQLPGSSSSLSVGDNQRQDSRQVASYQTGHRYEGQQLVQCSAIMSKPCDLSLYIGVNRKIVNAAKRNGMSAIAIKGYAHNSQMLRSADLIVDSFDILPINECYKIVRKALKRAEGPEQQTSSVPTLIKTITKSVSAESLDNNQKSKDTFADEIGSDQF